MAESGKVGSSAQPMNRAGGAMHMSIDSKLLRSLILVTFVLLFPAGADAQVGEAQVNLEHKYNFEVIIEPQVLSLARVRDLRSSDVTVTLYVVIIAELQAEAAAPCVGMTCLLQNNVTEVMGGTPNIAESEAIVPFTPEMGRSLEMARQVYGDAEIIVSSSVTYDPNEAERLGSEGYVEGNPRMVSSGGQDYKLTRWLRARSAFDDTDYGTASAQIDIGSGALIDFTNEIYEGRFEATAPIAFELLDAPEDPARRQKAIELFDKFRNRVTAQYVEIIETLNMKRQLLSAEDHHALGEIAPGAAYPFNKKITFEWDGEEKSVNFVMVAKPLEEPERPSDLPALDEDVIWDPT